MSFSHTVIWTALALLIFISMLCGYLLCCAVLWMKKLHWVHQFPSVHCLGTHFGAHCCEWNLSRAPIPAFLSIGTAYNLYLNLVPTQTWHVTFALNKNTDPSTFCPCSVGFLDPGFLAQGFIFSFTFFAFYFSSLSELHGINFSLIKSLMRSKGSLCWTVTSPPYYVLDFQSF